MLMSDPRLMGPDRVDKDSLRLITRVAELLFIHGETTEGIHRSIERLGKALGSPVNFGAQWGELTIRPDQDKPGAVVMADPVAIDIGRVNATERLVDQVCDHKIAPSVALAMLDGVAQLPPVALSRFMIMAAAGAASLCVIFGAADFLTIALTAVSAGFGAYVRRMLSRFTRSPFIQPFVASLVAGVLAALSSILHLSVSQHLLAACPCMVLVPGPHFLNGAIDLVRARIPLGAARIMFASLIVITISAGLFIGLSLGATRFIAAGTSVPVPLIYDIAAAGVAVAAYGAFFNMPWRMLPLPICIGMMAHALRWCVLATGASAPIGALVACTLVGFCTAPLSRRLRVPFGASAFAAVVSLIPGIFMFQTAADALAALQNGSNIPTAALTEIAGNIVTASMTLLAMTTGLIVPKMLLDFQLNRSEDVNHQT
ncbi:threonine/serine ThrE exporter family protein [Tardiphaga sp. 862_B3_N1_1]|uniref:threonine/serine ThrE exporter family protein n=1 Tax=Tardiphaga sp. 862_B3_N1_1 TaxID=3240763 RepID=UPI003F88C056